MDVLHAQSVHYVMGAANCAQDVALHALREAGGDLERAVSQLRLHAVKNGRSSQHRSDSSPSTPSGRNSRGSSGNQNSPSSQQYRPEPSQSHDSKVRVLMEVLQCTSVAAEIALEEADGDCTSAVEWLENNQDLMDALRFGEENAPSPTRTRSPFRRNRRLSGSDAVKIDSFAIAATEARERTSTGSSGQVVRNAQRNASAAKPAAAGFSDDRFASVRAKIAKARAEAIAAAASSRGASASRASEEKHADNFVGRCVDPVTGKIYHTRLNPPPHGVRPRLVPCASAKSEEAERATQNRMQQTHLHPGPGPAASAEPGPLISRTMSNPERTQSGEAPGLAGLNSSSEPDPRGAGGGGAPNLLLVLAASGAALGGGDKTSSPSSSSSSSQAGANGAAVQQQQTSLSARSSIAAHASSPKPLSPSSSSPKPGSSADTRALQAPAAGAGGGVGAQEAQEEAGSRSREGGREEEAAAQEATTIVSGATAIVSGAVAPVTGVADKGGTGAVKGCEQGSPLAAPAAGPGSLHGEGRTPSPQAPPRSSAMDSTTPTAAGSTDFEPAVLCESTARAVVPSPGSGTASGIGESAKVARVLSACARAVVQATNPQETAEICKKLPKSARKKRNKHSRLD